MGCPAWEVVALVRHADKSTPVLSASLPERLAERIAYSIS